MYTQYGNYKMFNNLLLLLALLCSFLLSGCAPLTLPTSISFYDHQPSYNFSEQGFTPALCLDFTGNRFSRESSFRNGLDRYLRNYASGWILSCSDLSSDEGEEEVIVNVSVYASKTVIASQDLVAEISLSSNVITDTLKYTVSTGSKFNGNPNSASIDNYDLGIIVGKSILNKLGEIEEFSQRVKESCDKYKIEEQRQVAERDRKLKPEVSNQETEKLYTNILKGYIADKFGASVEAYRLSVANGYKPTHLPMISNSLIILDESKTGMLPEESSKIPLKPISLNRKKIKGALTSAVAVIIQPISSTIKRDIVDQSKVKSSYISGYSERHNPAYDTAYREYQRAQNELSRVRAQISNQSTASSGWALGIQLAANVALETSAINRVNQANQKLAQTPQTTSTPIKKEYSYNKMQVKVTKEFSYIAYVVDKGAGKVRYKKYNRSGDKVFNLQYDKHPEDTGYTTYDDESDVETFEKQNLSFTVDGIVDDLVGTDLKRFETKAYSNSLSFISKPKAVKSTAVAKKPKAVKGKISALMQSVVAIQDNGGLTIGTGFFVKKDLILTNHHVVGDRKLVSVKTKGGQAYVGNVLDAHYDLDIALIEIEGKGSPVKMYSGASVSEGEDVIAIGNPIGLEYSVTKGIVSSIRRSKDKSKPLSKEYKYIQTDVPINPGNSGGPLFMNGKVVGINTLKIVSEDVEGIGFAIHYDEILKYLDDNNVHLARKSTKPIAKPTASPKKSMKSQEDKAEMKLTRLKKMFDKGLITGEEYKIERTEVLEKF